MKKMKKMKNYSVQKLNTKEIRETNGGVEWYQRISYTLGIEHDIWEYIEAKYNQGCACN